MRIDIVFAGSTDAECWYASIGNERAAVIWALNKCSIFIIGCPNVIEVTDHYPLTGEFSDTADLSLN